MPEEFQRIWEDEEFTYKWFAAFAAQPFPYNGDRLEMYDFLASFMAMSV